MTSAIIHSVSGPVVKARRLAPLGVGEAVAVGNQRLLGEVVRVSAEN